MSSVPIVAIIKAAWDFGITTYLDSAKQHRPRCLMPCRQFCGHRPAYSDHDRNGRDPSSARRVRAAAADPTHQPRARAGALRSRAVRGQRSPHRIADQGQRGDRNNGSGVGDGPAARVAKGDRCRQLCGRCPVRSGAYRCHHRGRCRDRDRQPATHSASTRGVACQALDFLESTPAPDSVETIRASKERYSLGRFARDPATGEPVGNCAYPCSLSSRQSTSSGSAPAWDSAVWSTSWPTTGTSGLRLAHTVSPVPRGEWSGPIAN